MSNHSVIEHRANYHFFKLEEDYVQICRGGKQYPQCKAAILAVLEHWINDKKAKGQDIYIYMTYPEWIDALYGLFRRSHILNCLNELVSDELILRRPCRRGGKDSYEYTLNTPVIQERLKQLPERIDKNTRPNLNAFKFKRVQKQTDVNLNASTHPNLNGSSSDAFKFGHNRDSLTEIPSDRDSQERGVSADASTPHALLAHDTENALSEENDPDETRKREVTPPTLQAIPSPQTPGPGALPPSAEPPIGGSHGITSDQASLSVSVVPEPAQSSPPTGNVASSITRTAQASGGRGKPEKPVQQALNSEAEGHVAQERTQDKSKRGGRRDAKPVEEPIPEEAVRIMDDWDVLMKRACPRTTGEKGTIAAALSLIPCHPSLNDLRGVWKFCFASNPDWYRKHGVNLQDIAKNIGKWQSLQVADSEPVPVVDSPRKTVGGYYFIGGD